MNNDVRSKATRLICSTQTYRIKTVLNGSEMTEMEGVLLVCEKS